MHKKPSLLSSSAKITVAPLLQNSSSLPLETLSKADLPIAPSVSVGSVPTVPVSGTVSTVQNGDSELGSQQAGTMLPENPQLTIVQPRASSPINTNLAASSKHHTPTVAANADVEMSPPILPVPVIGPSLDSTPSPHQPTLVEKIRLSEDKTLSRLAPITYSESGRLRVLIPDAVFEKGPALHKDFIICYYNGRAPPFNHMWGKGKNLEIHTTHSTEQQLLEFQVST